MPSSKGTARPKEPWQKMVLSCIYSPLLIAQIVLVLFLGRFNVYGLDGLMYLGWAVWVLSLVFGFLPIFIFKARGGVKKGHSYMRTTKLVDTGLYSIVRHPQFTAGILFSLAMVLMAQDWLIIALGAVIMSMMYVDTAMADKYEVEKFGAVYERYMKRVPGTNFIRGAVLYLKRRKGRAK